MVNTCSPFLFNQPFFYIWHRYMSYFPKGCLEIFWGCHASNFHKTRCSFRPGVEGLKAKSTILVQLTEFSNSGLKNFCQLNL